MSLSVNTSLYYLFAMVMLIVHFYLSHSTILHICRPSYTQPPARKFQKIDGGDKLRKNKHSKQLGVGSESKGGKEIGPQDAAMKYRGDAQDRFWATVEPYCADITEADIQMLQESINDVSVCLCSSDYALIVYACTKTIGMFISMLQRNFKGCHSHSDTCNSNFLFT